MEARALGRPRPPDRRGGGENRAYSRRDGFTLIEVLVAVVIGGLLAGAMVSLLAGQGLFYDRSQAALSAQRNARAAADLLSSELRVAAPEDLVAAEPDSVSLRFDVIRGIVCDSTAADEIAAFILDTLSAFGLSSAVSGIAFSEPYDSAYAYGDGFTGTIGAIGGGPKATCTANGAPASLPDWAYRSMTGWQAEYGNVPDRGSVVRAYRLLTYRFAPSVFGSATALWRGPQELVGPFAADAAFSYVMADGSVSSAASGAKLAEVVAIRVTATAIDDADDRFEFSQHYEFDVELRN